MAANKKDISALAGAMDEVEVAIRAVRERLSVDGLLDICTIAAPGTAGRQLLCGFDKRDASCLCRCCTGFPGGLLFESFVTIKGKRTSRRAMVALAKCKDEGRHCTDLEVSGIVSDERVGFFADVMCGLANRGRAANRQLLFSRCWRRPVGFRAPAWSF